jgi:hypothetical protein
MLERQSTGLPTHSPANRPKARVGEAIKADGQRTVRETPPDIPKGYRWSCSRATLTLRAPTVKFLNFVRFRVGPRRELSANCRRNLRCRAGALRITRQKAAKSCCTASSIRVVRAVNGGQSCRSPGLARGQLRAGRKNSFRRFATLLRGTPELRNLYHTPPLVSRIPINLSRVFMNLAFQS